MRGKLSRLARERVERVETFQHQLVVALDRGAGLGMGECKEPPRLDRADYKLRDVSRVQPALQRFRIARITFGIGVISIELDRPAETGGAVAAIVEHAGLDPARAEHTD